MRSLLVVHVLSVGLWLGCLATEIAFEKLMEADEAARGFVSALHDRVDRFVEGPAFVLTLVTGLMLAWDVTWTPGLVAKVGLGGAAIGLNVWCLKIVFDRADAAREGRDDGWRRIDALQHKVGAGVAILLVAATLVALGRLV